jgi:hypothetical protein
VNVTEGFRSQCDVCKQVFALFKIPENEYENQYNIASNFGKKTLSAAEVDELKKKYYVAPAHDDHHAHH